MYTTNINKDNPMNEQYLVYQRYLGRLYLHRTGTAIPNLGGRYNPILIYARKSHAAYLCCHVAVAGATPPHSSRVGTRAMWYDRMGARVFRGLYM